MHWSVVTAVIWTGVMLWTCGETVSILEGSNPDPDRVTGSTVIAFLVLPAIWLGGIGAIALLKYVFGRRE
jgi:hypothetical protein